MRPLKYALVLLIAAVGSAASQARLAPGPGHAVALFRPAAAVPPLPTPRMGEVSNSPRTIPRTYWLEGGVVGALALGLFAALLSGGLCESQSCIGSTISAFVGGGVIGFVPGALVGGQFRKAVKDTTSAR